MYTLRTPTARKMPTPKSSTLSSTAQYFRSASRHCPTTASLSSRSLPHISPGSLRTLFENRYDPELRSPHRIAHSSNHVPKNHGAEPARETSGKIVDVNDFNLRHTYRTQGGDSGIGFDIAFLLAVQKDLTSLRRLVQTDAASPHPIWTAEERKALRRMIRVTLCANALYTVPIIAIAGVLAWKWRNGWSEKEPWMKSYGSVRVKGDELGVREA